MSDSTMDINTKPGEYIRLLNPVKNGTEYDQKDALRALNPGSIYRVAFTEIHNFVTYVSLLETAGKFNSVLFENVIVK